MASKKVIEQIKPYFSIRELVSPYVYSKRGERAWDLFTDETLMMLLRVRIFYGKSLIINSSSKGYSQSGYREPSSTVGAEFSAHKLGQAFDLKDARMTLEANKELYDFVLKGGVYLGVRELESEDFTIKGKNVGWVHISAREWQGEGMRIINP